MGSRPPVILALRAAKRPNRQSCLKYITGSDSKTNPFNITAGILTSQ